MKEGGEEKEMGKECSGKEKKLGKGEGSGTRKREGSFYYVESVVLSVKTNNNLFRAKKYKKFIRQTFLLP